ncbi:hypothetical protein C4K68_12715 [Pokkaliibacter plantistimulans]|uniref:Uncharacterized protein n=1 Tax=Proteobacteria bacterium 228 TaxID=2083153 RepID=A0A2S5KQ68_9PROT|nr:hypothetical protein [Pokkaliibacter plantistimulans]PPC76971.1 hypothetical protein C4K68_12715 [Pokkaliibacter plantistimulans]
MKFKLFAKNKMIGETLLESGDPPMGVAFGELIPTEEYSKYQSLFEAQDHSGIKDLNLSIMTETGIALEPVGGIGIEDYSREMGEQCIQVNVLGIESTVYGQLFPAHVAAYEAQFK